MTGSMMERQQRCSYLKGVSKVNGSKCKQVYALFLNIFSRWSGIKVIFTNRKGFNVCDFPVFYSR